MHQSHTNTSITRVHSIIFDPADAVTSSESMELTNEQNLRGAMNSCGIPPSEDLTLKLGSKPFYDPDLSTQ